MGGPAGGSGAAMAAGGRVGRGEHVQGRHAAVGASTACAQRAAEWPALPVPRLPPHASTMLTCSRGRQGGGERGQPGCQPRSQWVDEPGGWRSQQARRQARRKDGRGGDQPSDGALAERRRHGHRRGREGRQDGCGRGGRQRRGVGAQAAAAGAGWRGRGEGRAGRVCTAAGGPGGLVGDAHTAGSGATLAGAYPHPIGVPCGWHHELTRAGWRGAGERGAGEGGAEEGGRCSGATGPRRARRAHVGEVRRRAGQTPPAAATLHGQQAGNASPLANSQQAGNACAILLQQPAAAARGRTHMATRRVAAAKGRAAAGSRRAAAAAAAAAAGAAGEAAAAAAGAGCKAWRDASVAESERFREAARLQEQQGLKVVGWAPARAAAALTWGAWATE